jgi:hypothetical protein
MAVAAEVGALAKGVEHCPRLMGLIAWKISRCVFFPRCSGVLGHRMSCYCFKFLGCSGRLPLKTSVFNQERSNTFLLRFSARAGS